MHLRPFSNPEAVSRDAAWRFAIEGSAGREADADEPDAEAAGEEVGEGRRGER
jgi:hypothetical protein